MTKNTLKVVYLSFNDMLSTMSIVMEKQLKFSIYKIVLITKTIIISNL